MGFPPDDQGWGQRDYAREHETEERLAAIEKRLGIKRPKRKSNLVNSENLASKLRDSLIDTWNKSFKESK